MSSTKAPGLRSASTGAAAAVAATAAASSSSSSSGVEKIAPPSITASEQALAACSGSVITSVLMTPFDVVKVRQQAWAHNSHNSSFAVVGRVVRAEGVSSLWSGLTPTLLMSVPSTILYLTAYEAARDALAARDSRVVPAEMAPLAAGGGARLLASTAVAPLELLRTRAQAVASAGGGEAAGGGFGGLVAHAASAVRREGASVLWRGLVPTLWRDVPFSMMYWLMYERLKQRAIGVSSGGELTAAGALGAGACAGTLAALATTPLDVVKTRQQVDAAAAAEGTAAALARIVRTEGPAALFAGLGPRLAKIAPSCAVMIASYEAGKRFFANKRRDEDATRTLAIAAKRASAAPGLPAAGAAAAALPPTEYEHPFFCSDGTKGKPPAP